MMSEINQKLDISAKIFAQGRFSLEDILDKAAKDRTVSDVHFRVGHPPLYRVANDLKPLERIDPLDQKTMDMLVQVLLSDEQRKRFASVQELDRSLQTKAARYRVNLALEMLGPYITIRIIPYEIPKASNLGFPTPAWQDIIHLQKGLVLVTGITGSGKSTTLASIIQEINQSYEKKIICVEDPIEYVHHGGKSLVIQREIGTHTRSFFSGVQYALRQDPDILLIGEIRDPDTARAALQAAETGHLVFSTLHTKDATGTIGRYVDFFPSEEEKDSVRRALADNLSYVLCQDLIPYNQRVGRVLAMEIMRNNPAISNLIREGNTPQIYSTIQTHSRESMITMEKCLLHLYQAGKIAKEVAWQYARRKESVKKELGMN